MSLGLIAAEFEGGVGQWRAIDGGVAIQTVAISVVLVSIITPRWLCLSLPLPPLIPCDVADASQHLHHRGDEWTEMIIDFEEKVGVEEWGEGGAVFD